MQRGQSPWCELANDRASTRCFTLTAMKKKKIMLQKTSSLHPERENSCQKSEALDHMFAQNLMTGFVFTPSSSYSSFFSHTATFEPFVNLRCATWDARQLPFADNYEHFIFPQSPGGVRAQFAFQNSSLCLTWTASLFFSLFGTPCCSPFLSPKFDSRRCERFWWEECPQWLGCYC